jgi:sortase A
VAVGNPTTEPGTGTFTFEVEAITPTPVQSRMITLIVAPLVRWTRRRIGLLVLASLVMVMGLVMSGDIAFQLWGSGIATNRYQVEFTSEFRERLALVAAGTDISGFAAPAGATGPPPDNDPVVWDDPVVTTPPTPRVTTTPMAPPAMPGILHEGAPAQGEVLGRIVIPDAEVDWMIVEGVEPADLRKGPGHMPWTALPGQVGNALISGHRTTNGAPFYNLNRLEPGDTITVETLIGTHTYEVVGNQIVPPTGVWVTEQWEGAWLTLTTCNPRYSARERLIVFAKLVDGPNAEAIHSRFDVAYTLPDPPTET